MALIKCYSCGTMVSDKAKSCPKCGCALKKNSAKAHLAYCPKCLKGFPAKEKTCPDCHKTLRKLENLKLQTTVGLIIICLGMVLFLIDGISLSENGKSKFVFQFFQSLFGEELGYIIVYILFLALCTYMLVKCIQRQKKLKAIEQASH